MITTEQEAIDYIYRSYLAAEPFLDYHAPDREKRHPEFTEPLLRKLSEGSHNILVTGSKGKGSAAAMTAGILQTEYERIGLFTSPHVLTFRERIRKNKELICEADFVRYCASVEKRLCQVSCRKQEYISPIGIEAAIAMSFFREKKTEFNVIECGKGVAYDDTRNISREYALINPVFEEHVRELGPGIREIAENKADIIQQGLKCVYVGRQSEIPDRIFHDRAREMQVPLKKYGKDFYAENVIRDEDGILFDAVTCENTYRGIRIPTWGEYQADNCAMAIAVCEDISGKLCLEKLRGFLRSLNMPGRMEIYEKDPLCILDACINRESAGDICSILEKDPQLRKIAILAVPEDKDYTGVAEKVSPYVELLILTDTDNPHYRFSVKQLEEVRKKNPDAIYMEHPEQALQYAKSKNPDIISILGTTALIAQMESAPHKKI